MNIVKAKILYKVTFGLEKVAPKVSKKEDGFFTWDIVRNPSVFILADNIKEATEIAANNFYTLASKADIPDGYILTGITGVNEYLKEAVYLCSNLLT